MNGFFSLLAMFMPHPIKLCLYRRGLGWKVGKGVKIGLSYLESQEVILGDRVCIGHFNIIRNLRSLHVGDDSYIGNFNQFFGGKKNKTGYTYSLILREKVRIMSHHFIDVAGTVEIDSRTTLGGRDTQIWSHSRTYVTGVPKHQPMNVYIGSEVYLGARVTIAGCKIPDRAIVGVGSVVTKSFPAEEYRLLIAGNPATIKKRYDREALKNEARDRED